VEKNNKNHKKELDNLVMQMIDCVPGVSIYAKDLDLKYISCNRFMLNMSGVESRDELIGKKDNQLPWKDISENLEKIDKEVILTKKTIEIEECPMIAVGGQKHFFTTKKPLWNDIGDVVGIVGVSVDITKFKVMEQAFLIATERAKISEQSKKEFLYNMRHDIRTPFSSIMGIIEHFRDAEEDDEKKDLLNSAYNAASEHLRMLNEVVEIIQIEEVEGNVQNKVFNLHGILIGLSDLMSPLAFEKKLKFSVNIDERIPKKIIGDSLRTHRVLMNLLSNAIKFTNKGHVRLSASLIKKSGKNIVVQFNIEDTGIGIPEDKKGIIFERFTRITPSYKGIYEGHGLGLRIVSKFLEDIGGEVYSVDNREGGGSVFKILIPYKLSLIEQELAEA
jgi:signal transduction histidine kinase